MRALNGETTREPFCWLEKEKLRILSQVFGEGKHGSLSAARSVVLALSEIASDKQSETFVASVSYIAQRAGVTSKTVRRMTTTFKKLGFLTMRSRSIAGLRASHEYTLIRGKSQLRFVYPSMWKPPKNRLRTREESGEESTESTARTGNKTFEANQKEIVIDPETGEQFNTRTGEYNW